MVKLGELCESINKKCNLIDQQYNYVEIGDITNNFIQKYTSYEKNNIPNNASNQADYGNILISCVRPNPSKIVLITEKIKNLDKYVFSSALANIKLKNIHIAPYIYSILYILSENFEKDLCTASQYPRFKPKLLNDIKIPIPKTQEKMEEWVNKISQAYNDKELFIQCIQELSQEAIPKQIINAEENMQSFEETKEEIINFEENIELFDETKEGQFQIIEDDEVKISLKTKKKSKNKKSKKDTK